MNSYNHLFLSQLLIEFEERCDAGGFCGRFDVEAIGLHHGAVVVLMGLSEFYGHGQLIVEVGQAGIRVESAGIQDGLGRLLDLRLLLGRGIGPGEVVVDDMITIPIST